jgi:hypothetical protein
LCAYIEGITGSLKNIFVIHGEESQSVAFGKTLQELRPKADLLVPIPGQVVEF